MPKPNRDRMPSRKTAYQSGDPITKLAQAVAAMPQDKQEFFALARSRFKAAVEAEKKFRDAALDDLKFLTGQQWPEQVKQLRDQTHRPCLTINRLPAIKSQIVNEQRAQRPGIVVKPVGQGSDVDTAEMLEGLLRHVQVNSDAEIAIDCAFEHMSTGGKGYLEVCRDFLPGETFNQELYVKRVKNPFTIYCDPASIEPDETDAEWKFKICDYSFDEYKASFPDTQLASLTDFSSIGDNFPGWADKKTIRVAEYWHKVWQKDELYQMRDGSIVAKSIFDLKNKGKDAKDIEQPIAKRPWKKCTVQCDVINAIETIDTFTFPGRVGYIPLIPCLGEDFDVNGERELYGFVRNAKDPQRNINFFRSHAAETIALAPKAPWVGWEGQFKDPKWKTSNQVNWAYLEASTQGVSGQVPSLPQRNQFEPPIQGVLAMGAVVDGDLKAVTGIYEPTLGTAPGDQSGKAIDLLQKQGGLTNLNWTDNLSRTLRHLGRVLLDAAPFVYDAPRVQRIIRQDGTPDSVIVHAGRANAADTLKTDEIQKVFDLSQGIYDVVIDAGPSYKTKQEKAFTLQLQLAEADKTGRIMEVASDIIVENSEMPGARQIAQRIRRAMPPNLLADDKTDPKIQLQQAQATIQQLEKQNQELMQQNAGFIDTIKTESVQQQAKIEVARIQAAATVEAAGIKAQLEQAKLEFQKFVIIHQASHERASAAQATEDGQTAAAGADEPPEPTGAEGAAA